MTTERIDMGVDVAKAVSPLDRATNAHAKAIAELMARIDAFAARLLPVRKPRSEPEGPSASRDDVPMAAAREAPLVEWIEGQTLVLERVSRTIDQLHGELAL